MTEFRRQFPLTTLNTLGVEASAAHYCEVETLAALTEALDYADRHGLPTLVLGGGSNIVLRQDYPGLVLHMKQTGVTVLRDDQGLELSVAAGENWDALVRNCLDQGWYGLENLIAIPGSAGAAPVQNIGAYGVELSHCLAWVEGWDCRRAELRRLSLAECQLGYRDSIFKRALKDQFIITALGLNLHRREQGQASYPALADFLLAQGESPQRVHPRTIAQAVATIRGSKLPDYRSEPNAGSFFKNPMVDAQHAAALLKNFPDLAHWPMPDGRVKLAAAWLVDHCAWKGCRRGPVGIHPRQAIVLVNYQRGSGRDVLDLAEAIIDSVKQRFGVVLEIEPRIY